MTKQQSDILLIKKYLNGELDTRAMHELEKRALDDPFLADAMEGFEGAAANQQPAFDDLTQRLKARTEPKVQRMIPYGMLAIAASVLIVFSIGWLWISRESIPKKDNPVAQLPVTKPAPAAPLQREDTSRKEDQTLADIPPSPKMKQYMQHRTATVKMGPRSVAADNAVSASVMAEAAAAPPADTENNDATPLNEVVVMNYTKDQKVVAKADSVQSADKVKLREVRVTSQQQALTSQARGLNKTPAVSPFAPQSSQMIVINGRIVDKTDGLPLPGATVRVAGTNVGAVTDVNGKFSLKVDSNKHDLQVGYLGYSNLTVNNMRPGDSLKTIKLEPAGNSLAEVVVTRPAPETTGYEATVIAAHPGNGWRQYSKYLKENAISPDHKTGVVKLQVTIEGNGYISSVSVKKGLSDATNQAALNLVKNGPGWIGSSNGKAEVVTLRVKFGK